MSVRKVLLNSADSLLLTHELKKIKKSVKDSLRQEYKLTDSLFFLLTKYPADLEVITDVLMFHSRHSAKSIVNNYAMLRLFVFDLRQRKMVIYNYKTAIDGENYRIFDPSKYRDALTKRFKILINSLNYYMKANKAYLKKRKSYGLDRFGNLQVNYFFKYLRCSYGN